jgi:hypothetical protein
MPNILPKGEAAFNKLYYSYGKNAENRGIKFSLSKKYFRTLTKRKCKYCGVEPRQVFYQWGSHGITTPYIYNGVDRVNNELGYIKTNVVTCCKICNQAKLNSSLEEFTDWIKRLINFNRGLR